MRACILAYTFYESDFRVFRYAEALVDRGDEVDVITLGQPVGRRHEVIRGTRVFKVQDRVVDEKGKFTYLFRILKFLVKSAWLMSRLHRRHPYDLVHVHSVPDFLVFAAIIPKLFGAKIILDIHDILPEFFASKFNRGQRGLLFKLLVLVEKISCLFSDQVIIANDIWRKKLMSRSAKPSRVTTLLNYPDTSIFFPRAPNRTDNSFNMLYHGTVNWHQGLDIAVQAMALIKDKAPQASLYIYGGGSHWAEIRELIGRLGLRDRVFMESGMQTRDIAEVVAQSDLGIIPKRNDQFGGEAFSTKTLEFMACGVPIIVSRTKVDQYYFNEAVAKFFEPENADELAAAMLALINDRSHREKLAANGREYVKKNNWGTKKQIYLELVDELVQRKRGLRSEVRDRKNAGELRPEI